MTGRPLTHHDLRRGRRRLPLPPAGEFDQAPRLPRNEAAPKTIELPQRPDPSILSEAIPVFYIGRSADGFWIARDVEGQHGGIFLLRSSAVRYAKGITAPVGCAIIDLPKVIALDIRNNGNQFIPQIAGLKRLMGAFARRFARIARTFGAPSHRLLTQMSRARAAHRLHREAVERELFRGHYRLASKCDDDLPTPKHIAGDVS